MNEQFSPKDLINALLLSFKISYYDFREIKGATVTLYKFRPQIGVRVAKIRNLKDELASALGVPSVRIIAPMEDGCVGIEVPNKEKEVVKSSDIFNSWIYRNTGAELPLAIGKTVDNEVFLADLAEMPHLLVAGATGQGKSVGLNVMLMSLLKKKSPDELRLILIDPKQVEFSPYSRLEKSYLAHPIITEAEEAQTILDKLCVLMDERYTLLSSAGVRNIQEYNSYVSKSGSVCGDSIAAKKLPYIVTVIDEYGDLIMTSGRDMERAICRIAQKARAVGIHLIISTQRPDTKIVTGSIKANFPTRIAFRTTTGIDSRVVLDQMGAERLSGRGDMIFFNGNGTLRMQCAYASISDVLSTCDDVSCKYNQVQPFALPLSEAEKAQIMRDEFLRKYEEEKRQRELAKKEAERRVEEWKKERDNNKENIEMRRIQMFRHFYGSNTNYMTLYIPHESKIRKN